MFLQPFTNLFKCTLWYAKNKNGFSQNDAAYYIKNDFVNFLLYEGTSDAG